MTDRELMQMALDALEYEGSLKRTQAIKALRDRLAKPEWVGLTEDEAIELLPVGDWEIESTLDFAKAIEAKLKEKNT
jgi:hypothetical protein